MTTIYTIGDGETEFTQVRTEPKYPLHVKEYLPSVIRGLFSVSGGEVDLEKESKSDKGSEKFCGRAPESLV